MKAPQQLMSEFEAFLLALRQERLQSGDELYAPMDYILALGGKRIRPLLVAMAYQTVAHADARPAFAVAAAVELFHNFSLLHDDIMDNAPLRRGMPTVHEKWNTNTAILAGDAMFALAYELLVSGQTAQAGPLVRAFTQVALGVCEGQMEDMQLAARDTASIPEYIEMIRKKTAMLIGGAMRLGALAAGADATLSEAFYRYGEAAGIGFQLHDDYLDVYAGSAKSGKQVAGDILENKKTYLLLRALEKAAPAQRAALEGYLQGQHSPDEKIAGVMALYAALDIPAETQAQIAHYFDQAHALGKPLADFPGFAYIHQFMLALMQRDH